MADRTFHHGRHAGVLVPLFSIPSRASWGVGEIADLPLFARWLSAAGLDLVQLLPVNEMEEGQNSPYSALSAMAIDPMFIALRDVEEFAEAGGKRRSTRRIARGSSGARRRAAVDFRTVRCAEAGRVASRLSRVPERLAAGTARAVEFQAFAERERWWLDDYALFRALHDEHHGCYWRDWEPELRDRDPLALDRARQRLADTILYYQYLQWLADTQWRSRPPRVRTRRDLRRFSLHGQRAQCRRLVAAASVSHRRVGRRAARRILRDRTGLGIAGVPLGRDAPRRLRVAAAARPPLHRSLRRLPRRSPGRLLSHLRSRARRP